MIGKALKDVYALAKQQQKQALLLSSLVALFLIILVTFQAAYFGHIQSLITTLGAYIQIILDQASTNAQPLVGYSVVSYVLADVIVKQALWKIGVAYLGLFISLFVIWNFGFYVVCKKITYFLKKDFHHTFKQWTIKNVKWFVFFSVYTIIYLFFNLKFSLIDQVILGSSWQQTALAMTNTLVRFLFLFFIIHSYTNKKLLKLPSKEQVFVFLFALVTIFVLDTLLGFLARLSSLFYLIGFFLLVFCISFFLTLYWQVSRTKHSQTTEKAMSKKTLSINIIALLMLFIVAFPFASFFLIEGLETSSAIPQQVTLQSPQDLANILRTSVDEIALLKESGIDAIVIEFSDFGCPFCKSAQPYIDSANERDNVFVYRRHFPVTSLHPDAYRAALYYECMKNEGVAYEAREFLYKTQGDHSLSSFNGFTTDLNLNTDQINTCMQSAEIIARIEHDIKAARLLGIEGTPTFYIIPLADFTNMVTVTAADKIAPQLDVFSK